MTSHFRKSVFPKLFVCLAALSTALVSELVAQEEAAKSLLVRVVDEKGDPVNSAKVYANFISLDRAAQKKNPLNLVTDKYGNVKIPIFQKLSLLRIWVSKKGYVSLFFNWEKNEVDSIPKQYKVVLQKGTRLSGTVVDVDGKPVAGAKLDISFFSGGTKVDSQKRVKLNPYLGEIDSRGDSRPITGDDGKWVINNAPPGDDLKLNFMIEHPNFIKDNKRKDLAAYKVTIKGLRDGTAKFTLTTGTPIRGKITDSEGKPIPKGLVIWGDNPYREKGHQEVEIDQSGNFTIPPRPPGKLRLTVVAPGWAPVDRVIDVKSRSSIRQDFSLKRGKQLRLKFLDTDNQPVPGVYVYIDEWHGQKALYNQKHPIIKPTNIPLIADDQGNFVWEWPPEDLIKLVIFSPSLKYSKKMEVVATGESQTIKLQKPFVLSGNVVNAITNEPISKYTIIPITYRSASATVRGLAQRSWQKKFDKSRFRFDDAFRLGEERLVAFRFQAPGFRDQTTRRFNSDSKSLDTSIKLVPVAPRVATLMEPDGSPSTAASVWIAKPDQGTMVNRFEDYFENKGDSIKPSRDGTVSYGAPETRYAIVAASPDGYAEKYLDADQLPGELRLRPWSQLRGELVQAGKRVPYATVVVQPIRRLGGDHPHVQDRFFTKTDDQGRFEFKNLPPVPSIVTSDLSPWRDFPITSSRRVAIELKPGSKHEVSLGGGGFQVTGKVKLEGDNTDRIQFRYGLNYLVRLDGGAIATPKHAQAENEFVTGESKSWTDKLYAGLDPITTPEQHFVKINDDGTFLINGVQPGKYRLLFRIHEPPTGCLVEPVGYGFIEFSTKEPTAKNRDMDLGAVTVKLKPFPKAGDLLPDFRFRSLDGQQRQISNYRGKFVLIDFWASWCVPCIQAFPEIAKFNESLSKDDDVSIISISVDKDLSAAKTIALRHRLAWDVGFAGESARKSKSGSVLGVSSVPTYLVLDPKGKIIYRGFSHEKAIEVLKKRRRD